ncbi:MAG: hypothetical protein LBN25_04730, partial [Christensenellaceae bacterium]|nr:hypothetical protein [Christensenellaceae bacterium]
MNEELFKKLSEGFFVTEDITEYTYGEDGKKIPLKGKQTKRYIPPDSVAIKAYADMSGGAKSYGSLTDEELEEIKNGILIKL